MGSLLSFHHDESATLLPLQLESSRERAQAVAAGASLTKIKTMTGP
jgi:hypothetical protein